MAAIPPNPFIPVLGVGGGAPNPVIPPLPPPPGVAGSDPNSLNPLSRRLKRLMPACFENSILRAGIKIDPERLLATSDGDIESLQLATSDRLLFADFIMIPLFAEIVSLDLPLAISYFDERPGVTLSAVPGLVGDRVDSLHLKKINWMVAHVLSNQGRPDPASGDPWVITIQATQKYTAETPVAGTTVNYSPADVCPFHVEDGAVVTFSYGGELIFVPSAGLRRDLLQIPGKAGVDNRTGTEKKNSTMSLDGTHVIVKPSGTSHSDLLDSLGAMRSLGFSPRYIAFFGEYGCLINDQHIKDLLYNTGLDFEHLPGWCAGARNISSYVTTLPVWRQPALYRLFLRFKYGTKPGELLWSSFFDSTYGQWNPLLTTVPLVHAMKGLSWMAEFHFGPEFKDWLGDACSLLEDRGLTLRFGAKVLYLQSVRALLRFSAIMRLEGAGVNGDPAASQFSNDPTNTVETSRALLPELLAHLYLIENIQDAKLNYDQLAVQAGLVTPAGQAPAAAPLKSALTKRKAAAGDKDRVLALLKAAPSTLFKQG